MRSSLRYLGILALVTLIPSTVYAQALINGVVKDTSGAVLPGVTVEAASPALIEKVRTVTTDGEGNYRIVPLPPGTYSVTFTLTGFNTVKREGVIIQGDFAASINAEMRVGALEETITVTGATPVVDIQGVKQTSVLDKDAIRDLPSSRHYTGLAALLPGVVISTGAQNVGGIGIVSPPRYTVHGSRDGDGRMQIEGFNVASATGTAGAAVAEYILPVGIAQEMTYTTSGGLGEAETAGLAINLVPRDGGNTVRGSWYTDFANSSMQGSNCCTAEQKAAGLAQPNSLDKVWELDANGGGAIVRDKLWYFVGYRNQGSRNTVANLWYNKNANDPTKWLYDPDLNQPGHSDGTLKDVSARITWQASPRNKFNFFSDDSNRRNGYLSGLGRATGAAQRAPEADGMQTMPINRARNITWNSPVTNRLLVEAGVSAANLRVTITARPGENPNLIAVTEQAGIIPNLTYRAQPDYQSLWYGTYPARASVSYVTGSHTMKVGFMHTSYILDGAHYAKNGIVYRFNNGVPNQLTISDVPLDNSGASKHIRTDAVYAQDSWVLRRLTVQGGVRYEREGQSFPSRRVGFTTYIPNGFFTPESDGVKWDDITPRVAAAYDVKGDGKTALKFEIGKFIQAQDGGGTFGAQIAPIQRIATSTSRAWNDANRNFVPDCNLLNPAANGECGADAAQTFGQNVYNLNYDPNLIYGWGKRPYVWELSASVQREVVSGLGVTVAYFRRWYGNFVVTDNRALASSDFGTFSVAVPTDPRLPNGGGGTLTGLYDVNPAKFGQLDNFVSSANNFGGWTENWNGVDVTATARAVRGITVSGGVSTGKKHEDFCAARALLPEIAPLNPFCLNEEPFLTQYKGTGSYTIPRIDVMVSGTFQSNPGPALLANSNIPNATIAPSLGRNLSGNAANAAVNLVKTNSFYGERTNEVDLRFAKILKYGRTRTTVGINLFNAFNAAPVTAYNTTYGANWLLPAQTMPARFAKLSVQMDF